jgi:hypothetical protein
VLTSGANVPDISRALDLLDCYPPIAGRPGRPRRRFDALLTDKGYSSEAFRQAFRERGTEPIMPKTPGIKAWASCATSSNRPSPCYTSSAGSPCAGNAASTSTTASSASPAS